MDEYKRNLRVENAAGPITYNQHNNHYPTPTPPFTLADGTGWAASQPRWH